MMIIMCVDNCLSYLKIKHLQWIPLIQIFVSTTYLICTVIIVSNQFFRSIKEAGAVTCDNTKIFVFPNMIHVYKTSVFNICW